MNILGRRRKRLKVENESDWQTLKKLLADYLKGLDMTATEILRNGNTQVQETLLKLWNRESRTNQQLRTLLRALSDIAKDDERRV